MPVTFSTIFWSKLFELFNETFDRVYQEEASLIGTPRNFTRKERPATSYQEFCEYLKSIEEGIDTDISIQGEKGKAARAKLHFQLTAVMESISLLQINQIEYLILSEEDQSVMELPAGHNILASWEDALAIEVINAPRRALKKIISKKTNITTTKSANDDNDIFSQAHIKNRREIKRQLNTVFVSSDRDKDLAQKYFFIVGGAKQFDQRLAALGHVHKVFSSKKNKTQAQTTALSELRVTLHKLNLFQETTSVEKNLNRFYEEHKNEIEKNLSALYSLPENSEKDFATKVSKKYSGFSGLFASKEERGAIEEYVNAGDQSIVHPTEEKVKNEFEKVLARSKADPKEKRALNATLMALKNHSSSETTKIALHCDDAYRTNIMLALEDCYTSGADQRVNADSVISSIELLDKIKLACGWFPTWKSEYKKAQKLLQAIDEIPADKKKVQALTKELSAILSRKKDHSFVKVATLEASVNSTWDERFQSAMQEQEKSVEAKNKLIVERRDKYLENDNGKYTGYPTYISETKEDCNYFVSEIFASIDPKFMAFENGHLKLNKHEVAASRLTNEISKIFDLRDQNQYFIVLLLSLELVRIKDQSKYYTEPLQELLLVLLGKSSASYPKAYGALNHARAATPKELLCFLPDHLSLDGVLENQKTAIYEAINAIVPFPVKSVASSPAQLASSPATTIKTDSVFGSSAQSIISHNNKSTAEINTMDELSLKKYAVSCSHEIVRSKSMVSNRKSNIETILNRHSAELTPSESSKSIVLVYTLWDWYQSGSNSEKNTKETKALAHEFMGELKKVIESNGVLIADSSALPKINSLQRLVSMTKEILPQCFGFNAADEKHSSDTLTSEERGSSKSSTTPPQGRDDRADSPEGFVSLANSSLSTFHHRNLVNDFDNEAAASLKKTA